MSKRVPIALDAVLVEHGTPEFDEVCEWPFEQNFVARLLRDDIPQRLAFRRDRMWVYRDPSKQTVGFGTIDVCDECGGKLYFVMSKRISITP
jgi:hypothetical protein